MHSLPLSCRAALQAVLAIAVLAVVSCSSQPRYQSPPRAGSDIAIETSSLPFEVPVFYTVMAGSRPISFFIIRMNDGVHAYFDACVSCYQQKLGYAYKDERVLCRACSMEFSIYKLEKGMGGCYPIQLRGRTENGRFLIPLTRIEAESGRF